MGGGLNNVKLKMIQFVIEEAVESGINFYDLCASGNQIFEPFERVFRGIAKSFIFRFTLERLSIKKGEYVWTRNLDEIKYMIDWALKVLNTGYIDFGYLHYVDEISDYEALVNAGVLEYIQELKKQGVVRHIGFSSHTPFVAKHIIEIDLIDMIMFSINVCNMHWTVQEFS